ncbi:DAK2 domain-containing protein [Pengzhenrongella sicca]|uniref:DAK2 domain-containing protein n=1 Tax=Pengzhenrongella sicca TaxID=2819238 RepID=A0A8A4ZDN1_9MICO|nr:DAK2 domain-containing protein [Pengzhenrongella sicca]QTE28656.1 DAK2 domain-containing protein [Pengzhenrongella sicca]
MERLTGESVRAWAAAATRALDNERGPIDSLNVFPVADADTGTNLYLTIAQGADEVGRLALDPPVAAALRAFAHGALLGARGNSGVIASQFLLGLASAAEQADPGAVHGADVAAPMRELGAHALAGALAEAQRAARAAVARPVEGTILTAATAAAACARAAADAGAGLAATVLAALAGARDALARTPDELAVLRAAQVVDAGAAGLVVILEALVVVVTGAPAPGASPIAPRGAAASGTGTAADPGAEPTGTAGESGSDGEFEVMYVVESADPGYGARLSARLQALGESVAVVGGDGTWHAHVHADDPAAAVAAGATGADRSATGAAAGSAAQRQIMVRHLGRLVAARPATCAGGDARPAAGRLGLVAGTRAPALLRQLARSGAVVMVLDDAGPGDVGSGDAGSGDAGTGGAVSAASVLRAVVDTGAGTVAVLPGSAAAHAAALAIDSPLAVHVFDAVDDIHVVAGLAAAAALDGSDDVAGTLAAIGAAVGGVRTAQVGARDVDRTAVVADELVAAGGEVLTVLRGAGVQDGVLAGLVGHLSRAHPALEVVVLDGGQASPAIALGVE